MQMHFYMPCAAKILKRRITYAKHIITFVTCQKKATQRKAININKNNSITSNLERHKDVNFSSPFKAR